MKKLINISIITALMLTSITSCKKENNSTSTSVLNSNVQQGSWRITYYNDSGNDETNHYTGYTFQFNSDGTVTATKAGSTVTGTWSSGNDDSTLKLILSFTAVPFNELNDDWHVIQQSSTQIKLEDASGGGGGTDYLTFEKI